jgi:hypothetical protein
MAFIVMRHGPSAALFQRQAGLGAVERLDLALFVNGQHNGVGWRIDVEADNVAQLGDELGILGELELAHPMRLEPMGAPDALNRADRNADGLGHHRARPVCRLSRRILKRQGDNPFHNILAQHAGGACLVAKKAVEAFLHEAFLPAPDAGFGLARPAHDLVRADAIGAEQNDLGSPHVFLGRVAILDESDEPLPVGWREGDENSSAHAAESHARQHTGIQKRTQALDFIH